jgi:hypothetical protein
MSGGIDLARVTAAMARIGAWGAGHAVGGATRAGVLALKE